VNTFFIRGKGRRGKGREGEGRGGKGRGAREGERSEGHERAPRRRRDASHDAVDSGENF